MIPKINALAAGMASLAMLAAGRAQAISLDDIPLWAGSGTNRAAVMIEWNVPEVFNNSTVPAPVASKTMVWGYRFNGTATGAQMLSAILAADPKLYVIETNSPAHPGDGHRLQSQWRRSHWHHRRDDDKFYHSRHFDECIGGDGLRACY